MTQAIFQIGRFEIVARMLEHWIVENQPSSQAGCVGLHTIIDLTENNTIIVLTENPTSG